MVRNLIGATTADLLPEQSALLRRSVNFKMIAHNPQRSADCPAITMTDPSGIPLTADEEFAGGFFCGSQARHANRSALPFTCLASQFGSTKVQVPAPGMEDDDKNPPRIASAEFV